MGVQVGNSSESEGTTVESSQSSQSFSASTLQPTWCEEEVDLVPSFEDAATHIHSSSDPDDVQAAKYL